MPGLPKSYMKVVRDLTGYWGTYLPTVRLAPGMMGEVDDGVFVKGGNIQQFADFDPARYRVEDQPADEAVTQWATKAVSQQVIGGGLTVPGSVGQGRVRLKFGQADEAAIICNGMRSAAFDDITMVKDLMRKLRDAGQWKDELCLITDVVVVDSAWLCFSTDRDQAADIVAAAAIPLPAMPLDALKAIAGNGKLEASETSAKSSAICISLPSGGTPLFRALRFNPTWLGLGKPTLGFVKGEDYEFEEPDFG